MWESLQLEWNNFNALSIWMHFKCLHIYRVIHSVIHCALHSMNLWTLLFYSTGNGVSVCGFMMEILCAMIWMHFNRRKCNWKTPGKTTHELFNFLRFLAALHKAFVVAMLLRRVEMFSWIGGLFDKFLV